MLKIEPIDHRSATRFLRAGRSMYAGDPHWVAPLIQDQKTTFAPDNPFFDHGSIRLWVARRDGADVGRIAGIIDQRYLDRQEVRTGFFGFFESENDPETARLLFQTVEAWARDQSFERLLGPVNPSTNDECGLLIDGFDSRPVFMMPYNPPYYVGMLENAGFTKAMDLLAYHIDLTNSPIQRLERIRDRFHRRHPEITLRPLRRKTFWNDLEKIRQIYNDAWEANWGFVPMTDREITDLARRLKPLLVEGLVWIAETDTEPIGFLLAIPDFNEPLQALNGTLYTPRTLGFLPYLWGWRTPRVGRVMVLGVKEAYRKHGIVPAMLAEGLSTGSRLGLQAVEASWVLENNIRSRGVIEAFGGKPYKTYRLYERSLQCGAS